MCSLTSGTFLIHNFPLFRMYSPTSGTYPIHNFTLSHMYSLTSGTYLIHNFPSLACIPLPLAHTYFIISLSFACIPLPLAHVYFFFFLFSHVFPCFWHIPISSFFFFRMYSFASCTCLFPLFSLFACVYLPLAHTYFFFFLFSHVFPYLWHIPISSFFSFRMCLLAAGTYLIHNFPLSRMYSPTSGTYLIHNSPSLACIFHITTRMFPMHVYFLQTNLLKNNAIIQIIEVNILKYPTQSCVTKWLKEKLIFELIF